MSDALIKVEKVMGNAISTETTNQCFSWYTTLMLLRKLGFTKVSVSTELYNRLKQ